MDITWFEFHFFNMNLYVDFAKRYNGGWKPLEVYVGPRVLDFMKQNVSKSQEHWLHHSYGISFREPHQSQIELFNFNLKLIIS